MAELNGLRVLITRPPAQTQAWRACLGEAGAETLAVPLLRIEPLTQVAQVEAIKRIAMNLDLYHIAIFISQNAVRHGLDWLGRYWPQAPVGIDYFAIGEATARALARHGFAVEAAEQAMNSEALLALPALRTIAGKKIVIFRGLGGRPHLAEQLRARGAQVDYCELYRRELPEEAVAALRESGFGHRPGRDLISVHSGETLTNLNSVIDRAGQSAFRQLPVVVPGERVAALAGELGFAQVIVAENATDASMLAALKHWYKESR